MIQRKQTVYLFLAVVATIVCLCLPLGTVQLPVMGAEPVLFNMALVQTVDNYPLYDFSYSPLMVLLAIVTLCQLVAIFMYKKRIRQSRVCALNIALLLLWMLVFAYFKYVRLTDLGTLQQSWVAFLPFVAAVFNYLAYKGIRADERLVRAADRIR